MSSSPDDETEHDGQLTPARDDCDDVIDETDQEAAPGGPPGYVAETVKHENDTRRYLAIGGMVLLAVLALGGLGGWLFGDRSPEEIQSFAVIFSPVVALLGPILGFYFSKGRK